MVSAGLLADHTTGTDIPRWPAVFDSIIFLFVTHPFDTGDRIAIKAGTQTMVMAVKRMSLLSTEFTITDGTDMYVANAVLADLMITNYRRSGYQWEAATLQIAFDTPLSKLDAVENDMKHWLSTEPERMFEPSTAIVPQKIEYMRSIEVTIGMTHRRTWQDWGMRWQCRNAFVAALCYYLKKHGIRYAKPNQPIIYWTEDAAALPPSYNDARGGRRPSDASEQILSPYDDSFDPTPPASPASRRWVKRKSALFRRQSPRHSWASLHRPMSSRAAVCADARPAPKTRASPPRAATRHMPW